MADLQTTPDPAMDTEPAPAAPEPDDPKQELNRKIAKDFRPKIEASKKNRRSFHNAWKHNVEQRSGLRVQTYTGGLDIEDNDRITINPDWSLTKTKIANLFSQMPNVKVLHENKQYAQAIPPFAKALNYEIGPKRANLWVAIREALNDIVNASGVGAVFIDYETRTAVKDGVPAIDTSMIGQQDLQQLTPTAVPKEVNDNPPQEVITAMLSNGQLPTRTVTQRLDWRIVARRKSPIHLLWPAEFVGSNFDDADFLGFRGTMAWGDAKKVFNLTDADKQDVLTSIDDDRQDDLRIHADRSTIRQQQVVVYDEIYYRRHLVDPDEPSFKAIWKIVFVHGLSDEEEPRIHEPWKGQKYDEQTKAYVGCCKYPIRFNALTYISDNPIPPSDTEAARPQVNDLIRSRRQMFENRDRSRPVRWINTNFIDPQVADNLMRGEWQQFIPVNGDGTRAVGEIARASYPAEDLQFDSQTKTDLNEMWRLGPNQQGSVNTGRKTKAEVETTQSNFATGMGEERMLVASWFLSMVEIVAGWMVLYSDFPNLAPDEKQRLQQSWPMQQVLHDLVLDIRPDSTVVLDAPSEIQRLTQFLNFTGKSGYVKPQPIIARLAELSGLDPAEVMTEPQPPKDEPNVSWRFSGKEDLINPLALAMLIMKGEGPTAEAITQAIALQQQAASHMPPPPPQQPGQPGAPGQPGQPPQGAPGQHPPGAQPMSDQHKPWELVPKVMQRSEDLHQ